jgi:DNA polymerase elongation subunit (family B)
MKKSYANCSACILYDSTGTVFDSNSKSNLYEIDEFYLIDGDWQKMKESLNDKSIRYLIMSPVICNSEDENTKVVACDICKENAKVIHDKCKPKKTFVKGKMSKEIAKEFNWSYSDLDIKEEEFDIFETIKQEPVLKDAKPEQLRISESEPYMFKIPDKYYSSNYRLVDVQQISSQSRIIYIFRDKDNKKEYFEIPMKDNDFYWYEHVNTEGKIIEKMENLTLVIGNYKNRCQTGKGYGGNNNLTTLHSVDYFLQNKGECPVTHKNIFHFDIEVYTYKNRIFPDPTAAMYPISAISFKGDEETGPAHVFLLKIDKEVDPRIDEVIASKKYKTLTVFTDEYTLISTFLKKLREHDPDFICGWNSNEFDIPYIVGRMKKLSIPMKDLSPYGNVYADARGRVIITGFVALDQMKHYKDFTYINLPTYKLDYVADREIKKSKVKYEGRLDTLYHDDVNRFIEYSMTDTELLQGIEQQCQHISIQDELRRITTTSHTGAASTIGQIEGLLITSMRKKGLISKNNVSSSEKEKLIGAYVFEARGGLYDGLLCDFDFASLYPSIINTWNLGPDTYIALIPEDVIFDYIYDRKKLEGKTINVILDPPQTRITKQMTLEQLDSFVLENNATVNISGAVFVGHDKKVSIFREIVTLLFNGRKEYKKKMFDAKMKSDKANEVSYYGKQMAYKILANSLYGVLGNEHFKFYNNELAKSITLTGQELLKYCSVHCDEFMANRKLDAKFNLNINFMDKVKSLKDVIYGDTDSMFVYLTDYLNDLKIPVKKSEEVQHVISTIQDHVNKDAISKFLDLHHIPIENSLIFLKNEFLFSKYYTLSGKKHYAAKVIAQEGKDVQDTEIKGLEIKRSEIPPRSQKLLGDILNIILDVNIPKHEILDKVEKVINQARKEMMDLIEQRDNSIVRTVSYSKPLSDYKNMPQHIKGMLMWNALINEDFRYGAKGKLWNIQAIDLDKAPESVKSNYAEKFLKKFKRSDLDCICLPEDVDKLPDFFIPDIKKVIEYACDERAENMLEPLREKTQLILTF